MTMKVMTGAAEPGAASGKPEEASITGKAAACGERLSQWALARVLRGQGHQFPHQNLRDIAQAIGLGCPAGQRPAVEGYPR